MSNTLDPDEMAHMSRLIWIYAVCKSLLLSPAAVKELILFDWQSKIAAMMAILKICFALLLLNQKAT